MGRQERRTRSAVFLRWTWSTVLIGLAVASVQTAFGSLIRELDTRREGLRDELRLFAGPTVILAGNQLQCALNSMGEVCNYFSQVGGGGAFWPLGTSDHYIFNSGLQIAGINGLEAGPWAGDTVGAYFYDPKGGEQSGIGLTDIYNSLNPNDLESWPAEAYIDNAEVFAPILLGRKTVSQQDTWVRYWEGDPLVNDRTPHPMGIRVDQRSLSWTYPLGNESVIYVVFELTNVTADPEFQSANEAYYFAGEDTLPDDGWAFKDTYVALGIDADVGLTNSDIFANFSTAVLPFDLGFSYLGTFVAAGFSYPPEVFYPPFFTDAPGLVGVKYLKSPIDPMTGREVGLTMFSNTQNPGSFTLQFPDPTGASQLWRYLSGRLDTSAGDVPCPILPEIDTNNPTTTERSLCFIGTQAADTRFFQASGPFELAPSQTATIAVAYTVAPTVKTMPDGSASGIIQGGGVNANAPSVPSFHPGFPSARGCDSNGLDCDVSLTETENQVTSLERAAGWFQYTGPPPLGSEYPAAVEHPTNRLDPSRVRVVPGSLLGNALVAQTVFDAGFLLGFAPEPVPFYLVPGDEQVTILWDPSPTEQIGDPFYDLVGDPESALYNPNYRQFDVEGYRLWRGTLVGDLELIAQFDYADTRFLDYTCETVGPEEDVGSLYTVPGTDLQIEVPGYGAGEVCPADESNPFVRLINSDMVFNNGVPGGPPGGGVTRFPTAAKIDTVIVSDRDTGPTAVLTDTGVPFVYTDEDVVNNFTYFYAVTAFDVNSMASGPHTLRSVKVSQAATPRATNSALVAAFDAEVIVSGDDGVSLNLDGPQIGVDAETGIFPGPQNPTNSLALAINPPPAEVADLLAPGRLTGVIDSVTVEYGGCETVGQNWLGACLVFHMTFDNGLETVSTNLEAFRGIWDEAGDPATSEGPIGAGTYPFDPERLAQFGIPADAGPGVAAGLAGTFDMSISDPAFVGQRVRRYPTSGYQAGGNRWFDGTEEVTPDPTRFIRAGHIEGVDSVWAPIHHTEIGVGQGPYPASGQMQCWGYVFAILGHAADFQVTWGEGGAAEVRDVTHHVPVDYKEGVQAGYGFLNTDGNGNGVIDWQDFDYLDGPREATADLGFCEFTVAGITNPARSALQPTAQLQPVSIVGTNPSAGPMASAGNGFAMMINGERYIFVTDQLPAAGTVWTYRTYNGRIWADDYLTDDPTNYELRSGSGSNRPPIVPNLQFTLDVREAGISQVKAYDLKEVHAVPDPYLSTSRYDRAPTAKKLMFVNLPPKATIRIYTLTGVLVDIVEHDDASGGGRTEWDVRNRNNQFVASGVYFFHVVTPDKDEYVGKFTIVNSGGSG